jgi:hypothetical protein
VCWVATRATDRAGRRRNARRQAHFELVATPRDPARGPSDHPLKVVLPNTSIEVDNGVYHVLRKSVVLTGHRRNGHGSVGDAASDEVNLRRLTHGSCPARGSRSRLVPPSDTLRVGGTEELDKPDKLRRFKAPQPVGSSDSVAQGPDM